ncbi:helix-turn-helix domain-containing protein [Arthrobacter sp. Y-9]|uniref:PucR family transcriptional regulator n=1 Tax=Arthrobacter sp. Y-9 TaxID=3039385 RepID=UPI00241EE765|nr:helix-turn-helix domain-containing protein [Arthrobacter sp. Y-9]WFR85231.1 helix-turn-helix domain-containing protein [Arthrobacter sp. Y-9]
MEPIDRRTASRSGRERSVRELASVLDSSGLAVTSLGPDRPLVLASPVILDPLEPSQSVPGGLLLGVGVAADSAGPALREAARAGYAAVVLKETANSEGRPEAIARLSAEADVAGIAVLVVEGELSWRQLDTLLESALGAVAEAGDAPTALGAGDLFALANAIAAMVGGATTIENLQEEVLAYSTLPDQPIDLDRQQGILGRQVPHLPENAAQYAAVFRARGAVRIPGTGEALGRLAVAVRAGNEPLGSVWVVDPGGDLPDEAATALERGADLAALHLLRARSGRDLARLRRAEGLRRLIHGDDDAALVARRLNLGLRPPFAVLAFEAGLPAGAEAVTLTRLTDLVSTLVESQRRGTWCVEEGGVVYAVLGEVSAKDGQLIRTLARRVRDRASRALGVTLRAALGASVDSAAAIVASRHSADQALLLLDPEGEEGFVRAADLHSRLSLLEIGAFLQTKERLVAPAAQEMASYDTSNGSEYAKTLLAYLESGRDSALTAAALSLHQNTLRYRLKRIRDLFDVDLSHADDVLLLWISLRAMQTG